MKTLTIIMFVPILYGSVSVWAQTPVPDPDTAIQTLPPRIDYIEDKKRIGPEEIPEPVRQTLESDAKFKDWRDAAIFHDENKDEYIIEFEKAGKKVTYRFNREGTPIIKE